ncbi:MAG: photosystem II reaction center PsbP family protein [Chloroflexota bacterium]|nr:photosystem II reaction center PsbP family protein [Chloroflexota bacterium]
MTSPHAVSLQGPAMLFSIVLLALASGCARPAASSNAASPGASEQPGTLTGGDIPDNAVFLTYKNATHGFSIQYVEGWQVSQQADGVAIRDKDSVETVQVLAAPSDLAAYIRQTDLPALRSQAGFKLVKQDTVSVGSSQYTHLSYQLPSPPDPVTGKRVASTVDRYYILHGASLAIVSLSTPDGVDNVDAFRQMIGSFKWA